MFLSTKFIRNFQGRSDHINNMQTEVPRNGKFPQNGKFP